MIEPTTAKYECLNDQCKLYKEVKEYEYIWGGTRPVCESCLEDPALLSSEDVKNLWIRGNFTSKKLT